MSNELRDHRMCAECDHPAPTLSFLGNDGPYCQSCLDRLTAEHANTTPEVIAALRYLAQKRIYDARYCLTHGNQPTQTRSLYEGKLAAWCEVYDMVKER